MSLLSGFCFRNGLSAFFGDWVISFMKVYSEILELLIYDIKTRIRIILQKKVVCN